MVFLRRALLILALSCLAAAAILFVHLTGAEERAVAAARHEADAIAGRAAAAIGSLLVFHDADGALETVRDLVPGPRLTSIVVLNSAGLPAAVWQAPAVGETSVARAAVSYEGKRVGTLVLGLSLASARDEAGLKRRSSLAAALALAVLGAGAGSLSVLA
ncbi:MAG: hypothetical protein ACXVID_07685, partial [Thermoanaerobaculia bacterium]